MGGVQIHVTDVDQFDPVLTGITILEKTKKLYPEQFAWVRWGKILDRSAGWNGPNTPSIGSGEVSPGNHPTMEKRNQSL